jgi:hypothetical protein
MTDYSKYRIALDKEGTPYGPTKECLGTVINAEGQEAIDKALKKGLVWTGDPDVKQGTRVVVKFNGFGAGTVKGFFSQDGFIGAIVQVDKRPQWHIDQSPDRGSCIGVFGNEINLEY